MDRLSRLPTDCPYCENRGVINLDIVIGNRFVRFGFHRWASSFCRAASMPLYLLLRDAPIRTDVHLHSTQAYDGA
jgi:hypothetical protein